MTQTGGMIRPSNRHIDVNHAAIRASMTQLAWDGTRAAARPAVSTCCPPDPRKP